MIKYEVYTDGACDNRSGCGGWGVHIPPNEMVEYELNFSGPIENCKSNKAEIIAAAKGLQHVQTFLPMGENINITIYTDSKYVINGITQWIYAWEKKSWKTAEGTPVKNKEEWQELATVIKALPKGVNLTWKHVKSHSGNYGNERADELAIEGRELAKKNRKLNGAQMQPFTEDSDHTEELADKAFASYEEFEKEVTDTPHIELEANPENKTLLGYIVTFGLVQTGLLVLILVTLVLTSFEGKSFYMECFTADKSIRCIMERIIE